MLECGNILPNTVEKKIEIDTAKKTKEDIKKYKIWTPELILGKMSVSLSEIRYFKNK